MTWIADNPKCWGGKPKPQAQYPWHMNTYVIGYDDILLRTPRRTRLKDEGEGSYTVTLVYDDISELQEIAEHLDKDETRYV